MTRLSACLLLAGCVLGSGRAAEPPPLQKLYVLLAFDTNDEDLAPSLDRDEKRVNTLLKSTIPTSRFQVVRTLKGKDLTAAKIVAAVKALKGQVTPDDAVLFFYGGHGALNSKFDHVLTMTTGGPSLARSLLRQELGRLKAGLTVLLTDCCSTKEKHDGTTLVMTATKSDGIHPTVKHLFFQARGVVDVTAATAEAAWSDDKNGGLFTRSLAKMLLKSPKQLTGADDGFVTWGLFFPQLQQETRQFFRTWSAQMRARYPDARIRAEDQKPHAFYLGEQTAFAAVEIQNIKPSGLKYRYRWEGEDDAAWVEWDLKPQGVKVHAALVKRGTDADDLPRLEIRWDGSDRPNFLKALMWEKDRAPRNLPRSYAIKR